MNFQVLGTLNTQLAVENLIAEIITGYFNYIQQVKLLRQSEICSSVIQRAT